MPYPFDIFLWFSVGLCVVCGAKLFEISHQLSKSIWVRFDSDSDGTIDQEELDVIMETTHEKMHGIEPRFWMNRPWLLRLMMQYVLFSAGQSICLLWFHGYNYGWATSCFVIRRGSVQLVCERVLLSIHRCTLSCDLLTFFSLFSSVFFLGIDSRGVDLHFIKCWIDCVAIVFLGVAHVAAPQT